MEDLFQIGVITSTHGIKGEVKVFPTTDDNNRFKKLKDCLIEYKGELLPIRAESCKFFKNMVILKFEDIDHINDVEKYRQCKLFVDRNHAVPLKEDEYFMADLLGLSVVTEDGRQLGSLVDIIQTGANDVYVIVDEAKREWLIPAIKDCILNIEVDKSEMTVRLLKGMEE
ncbi:MAG: 16S rRNA processing protein RimM [Lachnospiraceae bacterium]|nr:16S rRNA processing protein RimM [Lachnospiraceae bacterium]